MTDLLVVDTDGTCKVVNGDTDIATLQRHVGGYIEAVGATRDWVAYGNEEGRLRGMAANAVATAILHELGSRIPVVVGPVVFCGLHVVDPENGPEETDVPFDVLQQAAKYGYS
jgi:hypothetical protein